MKVCKECVTNVYNRKKECKCKKLVEHVKWNDKQVIDLDKEPAE